MSSTEDKLRKLLQSGKDWDRTPVKDCPGAFVVKAPAYRGRPASLMLEINPVGSDGAPTKRRGLMLRGAHELQVFRQILSNPKLDEIAAALDKVNPKRAADEADGLEI